MKNIKKIGFLIGLMVHLLPSCFSQDSNNKYSDFELIKLANYIKALENNSRLVSILDGNAEAADEIIGERAQQGSIAVTSLTDNELITIANYIKYLETKNLQQAVSIINKTIKKEAD